MQGPAVVLIPIALGLAAAGVNWYALNEQVDQPKARLTRVTQAVKAGTPIPPAALEEVEFGGPPESIELLRRSAVPFADRTVVAGRPVHRDLQPNDLVFWRDFYSARGELSKAVVPITLDGLNAPSNLLQVGDQIGFLVAKPVPAPTGPNLPVPAADPPLELVGPFKVSSVGDLVSRQPLDSREARGQAERVITVEVEYDRPGAVSANLQKVLTAQRADGGRSRVYGVVLMPQAAAPPEAPASPVRTPAKK